MPLTLDLFTLRSSFPQWLIFFLGVFLALRDSSVLNVNGEADPKFCEGIVCKPKPTEGVCVARNATTLSASSVYGPQRICCSVYACTHANKTTTLHYGNRVSIDGILNFW